MPALSVQKVMLEAMGIAMSCAFGYWDNHSAAHSEIQGANSAQVLSEDDRLGLC